MHRISTLDFILQRVEYDPFGGCWLWTGDMNNTGYGLVRRWKDPIVMAHRQSYEEHIGPIPEGFQIDHLCRVRTCVNPAHLEPVTGRINRLRGTSPMALNAQKTHCVRGHEFTVANTLRTLTRGTPARICRTCSQRRCREYDRAKRVSTAAMALGEVR